MSHSHHIHTYLSHSHLTQPYFSLTHVHTHLSHTISSHTHTHLSCLLSHTPHTHTTPAWTFQAVAGRHHRWGARFLLCASLGLQEVEDPCLLPQYMPQKSRQNEERQVHLLGLLRSGNPPVLLPPHNQTNVAGTWQLAGTWWELAGARRGA